MTVHPRLRGELSNGEYKGVKVLGSSPLTRGTRKYRAGAPQETRFIPAYAGNSGYGDEQCCKQLVHPRLRGELA